MLTTALFAGASLSVGSAKLADVAFTTSCDGAYAFVTMSGSRPGDPDLGHDAQVKCIPFAGKGNPSGFYRLNAVWTTTEPFEISGSMSSEIWTVTLANNHVVSIDFSTDYRKTLPSRLPQLFLSQGSKLFIAEIPSSSINVNQWISASKTLTSNDFVQVRPEGTGIGYRALNSHPDFSTSGASMNFMVGLDSYRTTTGVAGSENLDYDNIHLIVHTVPNP
jgi:hypothetical protein